MQEKSFKAWINLQLGKRKMVNVRPCTRSRGSARAGAVG